MFSCPKSSRFEERMIEGEKGERREKTPKREAEIQVSGMTQGENPRIPEWLDWTGF